MRVIADVSDDVHLVEITRQEMLLITGSSNLPWSEQKATQFRVGATVEVSKSWGDSFSAALSRKENLNKLADQLEKESKSVRALAEKAGNLITPPPKKVAK